MIRWNNPEEIEWVKYSPIETLIPLTQLLLYCMSRSYEQLAIEDYSTYQLMEKKISEAHSEANGIKNRK